MTFQKLNFDSQLIGQGESQTILFKKKKNLNIGLIFRYFKSILYFFLSIILNQLRLVWLLNLEKELKGARTGGQMSAGPVVSARRCFQAVGAEQMCSSHWQMALSDYGNSQKNNFLLGKWSQLPF